MTVTTFLGLFYYFLEILELQNLYILLFASLFFIALSGFFISKLAIDPLKDYIQNLQDLSKETLHELNLPISTISINTQMIKKSAQDQKTLRRISRVESACDMLKQRYNELDYMIKMQTKQQIKEECFVDELIKQRVEFLSTLYPDFKFELKTERLKTFCDKTALSKSIDNIINNGVKYSNGSNRIEISLDNNTLSIKDFGIGMDEVELLKIFDNYYQANKEAQGFGIGLGIVKRFCDENMVELTIKSSKNQGTTVKLKFKDLDANK